MPKVEPTLVNKRSSTGQKRDQERLSLQPWIQETWSEHSALSDRKHPRPGGKHLGIVYILMSLTAV